MSLLFVFVSMLESSVGVAYSWVPWQRAAVTHLRPQSQQQFPVPNSRCCSRSAVSLCAGVAFELTVSAVNGGALDPHAGRGGMVCDTSLTVWQTSGGHEPAT